MNNTIKVGFCIAYDWYMLRHALPLVYNSADIICLSLDKDRISWAGDKFILNEIELRSFINQIDTRKKIQLLEEDFHIPSLTAGQNEVRQRNRIADYMGPGGWHIQLDCDEYFQAFPEFVSYLKNLSGRERHRTNICCPLLTLYRQIENGYLYIQPRTHKQVEFIQIATQQPNYEFGRRNGDFNMYTSFSIIHQSWARSEEEIKTKLSNWGHVRDFDVLKYFEMWRSVNEDNYTRLSNFHPIQGPMWPSLSFVQASDISDFLTNFKWQSFPYTSTQLTMKNNRFLAKLNKLKSLIIK